MTIVNHTSELSSPWKPIVIAPEVDGVGLVEPVLLPLLVPEGAAVDIDIVIGEPEVADAVAGMLERAGSEVYAAVRPVTFVQRLGGAMVPATKFTAAHYRGSMIS